MADLHEAVRRARRSQKVSQLRLMLVAPSEETGLKKRRFVVW